MQTVRHQNPKPTHYMPSGMGGVFEACIVEDMGEHVRVRIISKAYPDWHGKEFTPYKTQLTPIVTQNNIGCGS